MYPARYYLLAEYCGIPSSKWGERPVCMLRGFFDDSREEGCVFVLAGYVASVDQWLGFSDRWEQALTIKAPRWVTFKMRDVDLRDPFQLERAEYHYRIIEEFIPQGFCIAVPIPVLAKVTEELRIEPKFRNPYYMAWNITVSTFRNFYKYNGWNQSLDIFFDMQAESKMVLEAWDIMAKKNGDILPFVNAPMFRNDEEVIALQAADLLAWWARKNWVEHGTFGNQKWLFPWNSSERGPNYLFAEMNEAGIRQHFLDTIIWPDSALPGAE